jgi:hypothetical protein
MNRIYFVLGTVTTLLVSTASHATHCTYAPDNNESSGDNAYTALWCPRQDIIDFFWDQYDFDKGDWDDGFGYWDVCNPDQPLGRTMSALYALQYSDPNPTTNTDQMGGTILRYGSNFAMYNIDELDGRCYGSDSKSRAHTVYGYIIDNYTELYWPFFYGENVIQRAATILHESRHADWVGHDDDNCPRHASCDDDWDMMGANMFQVMWLWDYYVDGVEVSPGLKDSAAAEANMILDRGFNSRPPYHVPDIPPTF